MKINRRGRIAGALLGAILLSQAGLSSARGVDDLVDIQFSAPAAVTLEYGQYWSFPMTSDNEFQNYIYQGNHYEAPTTGTSGPYAPSLYLQPSGSGSTGALSAAYAVAPLVVGSYTFTVKGSYDDGFGTTYVGETPTAARLTVEPARLGIDLRLLADPNNAEATVVTAKFTGRFVDEYQSSFFDGAAMSPAGEWRITLKDEEGAVAIERNFERNAGDDILATSFYWTGAKPDTEYTATAEFVATGASAANFAVSSATTFSYTAPAAPRIAPSSTATATAPRDLPEASGFGLPLWALLLSIIIILGLGVLVTILSVRLSKRPVSPSTGPVTA